MNTYKDQNGALVTAFQLKPENCPIIINASTGEICAEPGQWIVEIPGLKPTVFTDQAFNLTFEPVEQ